MATLKKALTAGCTWIWKTAQGLSGLVFCSHNHRIRRAHPSCCRWEMPRPPSSGGRVTLGQANRQCPPFASLLPLQRKALLILSIALRAQGGRSIAIAKYTNMEVSTN
uniref:Uncharacterized protein n=1 Tax=Arundo donax TaxID=35708 RepID=A0A0A8ZRY4_ARUDO